MTVIKRGLDLPISGKPAQAIELAKFVSRVGLVADDYVGMKPTMFVTDGDQVKLGQPVFEDKKTPGVIYTAPAAGRVVEVVRGAKRKFESLVIAVEGEDSVQFETIGQKQIGGATRQQVTEVLTRCGVWPGAANAALWSCARPRFGSASHLRAGDGYESIGG